VEECFLFQPFVFSGYSLCYEFVFPITRDHPITAITRLLA